MNTRHLIATLSLFLSLAAQAASSIPCAIRWDPPWYGGVIQTTPEATLGPVVWQSRVPFFGTINSIYDIGLSGATQATMDAEISYAHTAKVCWAFLWYGINDASTNGWKLFQSSSIKSQVNWVQMEQFGNITGAATFVSNTATYIGYFQQANYQEVISGRPLWYIYLDSDYSTYLATYWGGSAANFAASLATFRSAVIAAGVANPYVVIMSGTNAAQAASLGGDATSAYIPNFGTQGQPSTWATTEATIETYWAQLTTAANASSIGMVPIAATGWDTRARVYNSVRFTLTPTHRHFGQSNYTVFPTANQLTVHLTAAVNYVVANPISDPSTAILIYAWNEHDEGGSVLDPTYSINGPVLTILNAAAAVIW